MGRFISLTGFSGWALLVGFLLLTGASKEVEFNSIKVKKLVLVDESGVPRGGLLVGGKSNAPIFSLTGANGAGPNIMLSVIDNKPCILMMDEQGRKRVELLLSDGESNLSFYDLKGNATGRWAAKPSGETVIGLMTENKMAIMLSAHPDTQSVQLSLSGHNRHTTLHIDPKSSALVFVKGPPDNADSFVTLGEIEGNLAGIDVRKGKKKFTFP